MGRPPAPEGQVVVAGLLGSGLALQAELLLEEPPVLALADGGEGAAAMLEAVLHYLKSSKKYFFSSLGRIFTGSDP